MYPIAPGPPGQPGGPSCSYTRLYFYGSSSGSGDSEARTVQLPPLAKLHLSLHFWALASVDIRPCPAWVPSSPHPQGDSNYGGQVGPEPYRDSNPCNPGPSRSSFPEELPALNSRPENLAYYPLEIVLLKFQAKLGWRGQTRYLGLGHM